MNSRYRHTYVLAIASALLAACSSTTTNWSGAPPSAATAPYFIDNRSRSVDIDYIDRYACAGGRPLVCERSSRVASRAECKCPL
jgi:hypothetical protein